VQILTIGDLFEDKQASRRQQGADPQQVVL
jgi:hypothetical protein